MKVLKKFSLKSLKFGLVLGGLLLCFTACQKDDNLETTVDPVTTKEANFAESSKIMAAALSNLITADQAWENAIKERTTLAENGDNVFLYAFGKDMKVNDQTLSEALASHSGESTAFFSNAVLNDFPLISIAYNVPVRFKEAPMSIDINTVFYNFQDDDNYTNDQEIPHFVDAEEKLALYGDFNKRNDAFFVIKNNERIILLNNQSNEILNDVNFERNYLNDPIFKDFFYSNEALIGTLENVEYRLNAEIGYTATETMEMMEEITVILMEIPIKQFTMLNN